LRSKNESIAKSLFSAAEIAPSSSNVYPCTLLDGEFWHSQNIAAAITTAIRGGSECRVCTSANIAYCMPFLISFRNGGMQQFPKFTFCSTAAF